MSRHATPVGTMVRCPYNPSHTIPTDRFQTHITKCRIVSSNFYKFNFSSFSLEYLYRDRTFSVFGENYGKI
jgi:hypothetical protein